MSNTAASKTKNQATDNLEQILSAAHDGQVDTLIVAAGAQKWGRFDASARKATYDADDAEPTADSEELLGMAVSLATATDAQVYVSDRDDIPQGADAIATPTLSHSQNRSCQRISTREDNPPLNIL